ncbi:hypothetical protein PsorP6_007872 [Peronosclerospora sorghi]|uniref:Uncharacterized protein n=1 Tax=Peronosclerospora sorghi TaxID=230839 RepID=A0ACC0WAX3_9STRA|nr:hypothetical protein PsorP6_007872 [Peronosclerospora sorghi]
MRTNDQLVARHVGAVVLIFLIFYEIVANVREHDYGVMAHSSAAITQQICAVLIFVSVFEFFRQDAISAVLLSDIDAFFALVGFSVLRIHLQQPLRKKSL